MTGLAPHTGLIFDARFNRDTRFDQLHPKYDVSPQDIELYIKSLLNQ